MSKPAHQSRGLWFHSVILSRRAEVSLVCSLNIAFKGLMSTFAVGDSLFDTVLRLIPDHHLRPDRHLQSALEGPRPRRHRARPHVRRQQSSRCCRATQPINVSTPVNQKPHASAAETEWSLSPAMTAWT